MPGLPNGWEADYDGKRWFYTYVPSSHVQYHFPSEGDEFPDFIDFSFPAPALAPEERLESQQQVKRQAGGVKGLEVPEVKNGDGMTASARPVSAIWDDEGENEQSGIRPENFMFLGPGTYDVSPLPEEEDEEVKKVVVGPEENAIKGSVSLESSPALSRRSPRMDFIISEAGSPAPSTAAVSPPQDPAIPTSANNIAVPNDQPVVHMIDSREVAAELFTPRHDPVGNIPEMASAETAKAYIEIHPDPVEIADNSILAPIETTTPSLDDWAAPSSLAQTTAIMTQGHLKTGHVQRSPASSISVESGEVNVATELKYKPFKPGQIRGPRQRSDSQEARAFQASLQREKSLLMGRVGDSQLAREGTPMPMPSSTLFSTQQIQHPPPLSIPQVQDGPSIQDQTQPTLIKYPSVLRPARGRALSQPTTSNGSNMERNDTFPQAQPVARSSHDTPVNAAFRSGPPLPPKIPNPAPPSASQPRTCAEITPYIPRMGSAARKSVPARAEASSATLPVFDPMMQNRRHSSFTPLDANRSRSESVPLSIPQSPQECMRRGSSAVSLAQSLSHSTLFTPSPQSLTPGSEGLSGVVSPLSGSSSQNHVRGGAEQGSYFIAADTGRNVSPGHGAQRSDSVRQLPPVQRQAFENGTRPNRMSLQASPSAGNLLNSIREHDEILPQGIRPLGSSKRHSMVPAFPFSRSGPSQNAQYSGRASPHHHQQTVEQYPRSSPAPVQTAPYPLNSDMRPEPIDHQRESTQSRRSAQAQAPPARLSKPRPGTVSSQDSRHPQACNEQGPVSITAGPTKDRENKFKKWFKNSKPSAPAEAQVPPAGHPHAPPSGWHANSSIPQPSENIASGTMPWSPGQINAATFAHHPAAGRPAHGAIVGPNLLHMQRPGHEQQMQRPRPNYEPTATRTPGGPYPAGKQGFGGNGQQRPEPPMYGSAIDL